MELAENGEDEVVRLLNLWGLSDLKAKFKANYIIPQALEFLTEDDIVDLIPKIGQRAIFRGRLIQWRQQNCIPSPKSLKSDNFENTHTKQETDTKSTISKVIEAPSPIPTVKIPPKPYQNIKKPPQKPKSQDEMTPKPCIQSKVQKFYITPTVLKPDSPVPLPSPSAAVSPSHIMAPDLTPFVTSIIRVETNCNKKSNAQPTESASKPKVNRTRIFQKVKLSDGPSAAAPESSPPSETHPPEPKQAPEEGKDEHLEEEHPDARHLYPIIKLETETADTNWNDYNSEPELRTAPEPPAQVITKREPEEVVADSTGFQPETMDTADSEFYNENDNPLLKLEQMSPKDIRPRRKRARNLRKFDIRTSLMNSRMGRYVLQYYEKNGRLDAERRRMLIDAVVQDFWTTKRHVSLNNSIQIALEIVRLLPNEKVEDYVHLKPGGVPKSPLYNKYRTLLDRRRLSLSRANRKKQNALTQGADDAKDKDDDVYIIS